MEDWTKIIETALIGTDKKPINSTDFGEDVQQVWQTIQQNTMIDTAEQFLQLTAVAYNYKRTGAKPLHNDQIAIAIAEEETYPYCNTAAQQTLNDILLEDSTALLELWLKQCVSNHQLVPAQAIPALLDIAKQHSHLQSLIQQSVGNRGKWLSQFNSQWNVSVALSDEELWQTGTPAQRKTVLQQLRLQDATKALEWLQQTWPQENAANKQSLLEVLETNLADADIAWLETLTNEKSVKVKDEAERLLKLCPTSTIVKQYCAIVQQCVGVKKERTLLGLSSKQVLYFTAPVHVDEAIFASGIEKLSGRKELTDEENILYQLLQKTPPTILEQCLQLSPQEIIELIQKEEVTKKYLPAIVAGMCRFKDTKWAMAFMQYASVFYLDILPLIPLQQQEHYSRQFFVGNEHNIILNATKWTVEWSVELTKIIFTHLAANPYQFYKSFYNQHIHLIPIQAMHLLNDCEPKEEYAKTSWANTKTYISKLLILKQQINTSFQ